jgi:CubicO group peptidase (beta-lactamase class C family)
MKNILVIIALALFISCQGQSVAEKMDQLMTAYANNYQFNGSVLVAHKGKVILEKGYGYRNAAQKIPNDQHSIFQIGSVTKQFTAAIIMQLQQEKKLSVKDPLSKYFPGFTHGDKITIENLLNHTSGLYNYTSDSTIMNSDVSKPYAQSVLIEKFKKYPPDFEPGSKWSYSNSGYSMLGYIIEKVTGKPYEKVMRERILSPLGMSHSGFDYTHLQNNYKTTGYFSLADSAKIAPIVDSTLAYSAGALYSTVGDLYKWERAIYTDKILKPESWKQTFTPFLNKYGYGWGIDTLYGKTYMAHSGGIHGFTSYLMRFPEEELVVIAMDNSSHGLSKISRSLVAIALDKPYTLPEPKKSTQVSTELLQKYVGEYELMPNFTITVTLDGNQLKGQATGQPAFDLFPEKENLFFLKVVDAKVEFIRDEKGEVKELILYQNGQQPRGKKIK